LIASTAARRRTDRWWPSLARGPLRVGLGLLSLFVVVALLVGARILEPIDLALMGMARTVTSAELDVAVGVISYMAAAEVSLLLMLLLALWLRRRGLPLNRAAAPLLFLFSVPIEIALKLSLEQPVPSAGFYRRTIHYALLGLTTPQSFPSGHATRTAFMTVLAIYLVVRWGGARRGAPVGLALGALALVAGWSRIYLGYHWPLDVVGGFLLGGGMAWIAIAVLEPARAALAERERPYPERSR
jgi:membrane-associated phospholipid phosphatase